MSNLWILLLAIPLQAAELELCLVNSAQLDDSVLQSFRKELGAILSDSGRSPAFPTCRTGMLTITFRLSPPAEEPAALAGIKQSNNRLLPEIDVFTGAVAQILSTNLPSIFGRALARVAVHELGHWFSQESDHSGHGVMMERLSAAHLMAPKRDFFRLKPASD